MKDYLNKYKTTYHTFPKLPEMRKLCHFGYWDGPLSGLCLIDGQKYWLDCIEEWHDNNHCPSGDSNSNLLEPG